MENVGSNFFSCSNKKVKVRTSLPHLLQFWRCRFFFLMRLLWVPRLYASKIIHFWSAPLRQCLHSWVSNIKVSNLDRWWLWFFFFFCLCLPLWFMLWSQRLTYTQLKYTHLFVFPLLPKNISCLPVGFFFSPISKTWFSQTFFPRCDAWSMYIS